MTALVGDFTLGATLFVREGLMLRISDSDQDDFIRNPDPSLPDAARRTARAVLRCRAAVS